MGGEKQKQVTFQESLESIEKKRKEEEEEQQQQKNILSNTILNQIYQYYLLNQKTVSIGKARFGSGLKIRSVIRPEFGMHALLGFKDNNGNQIYQAFVCLQRAYEDGFDDVMVDLTQGGKLMGTLICHVELKRKSLSALDSEKEKRKRNRKRK